MTRKKQLNRCPLRAATHTTNITYDGPHTLRAVRVFESITALPSDYPNGIGDHVVGDKDGWPREGALLQPSRKNRKCPMKIRLSTMPEPERVLVPVPHNMQVNRCRSCGVRASYSARITFTSRDRYGFSRTVTQLRQLCDKHAKRYANTFRLEFPKL